MLKFLGLASRGSWSWDVKEVYRSNWSDQETQQADVHWREKKFLFWASGETKALQYWWNGCVPLFLILWVSILYDVTLNNDPHHEVPINDYILHKPVALVCIIIDLYLGLLGLICFLSTREVWFSERLQLLCHNLPNRGALQNRNAPYSKGMLKAPRNGFIELNSGCFQGTHVRMFFPFFISFS